MKSTENNDYIKKLQIERIRGCMKKYGISNKHLAEKLNYSPQHISYILNGKRNLTVEMAISMAEFFSKQESLVKYVRTPYHCLSQEDKEFYYEEYLNSEDGSVNIAIDIPDYIDYRYLLGESDYKNSFESWNKPKEKDADYLFKKGIGAILHYYGYELRIATCPDITTFHTIDPSMGFFSFLRDMLTDPREGSKIINISTGETIEMLPAELYQLFQDFSKAIVSITERKFEERKWLNILKQKAAYPPDNEEMPFE